VRSEDFFQFAARRRFEISRSARGGAAYPDGIKEERVLSSDTKVSDQALLERIAGRDAQALADLYDRYAPAGLALAARILGDRSEAEDVLQVVFTRVWQEAGRYDPTKGSPASWLLSWIRNGAIDRLRRRDALRRASIHSADRTLAGAGDDADSLDAPAEREKVARAVADLPPDQRQVIELAYFEGLSQTQIAQRLGEPLGTIKTRMRLGMVKLRQALPVLSGEAH
jgi:RNA polymerase sigma-70 factor (ECF subfamily)